MSFQLRKVKLQSDVYLTCLQHALSTETFEIMGLLIGENEDNEVINILAVKILRRSDKKKDRVEISPEQLINAASQAEMLSTKLNKSIRVVGWYHSHPHITVYPSPVDVRTQASHQIMDLSFVGLIFSVFSENKKTKISNFQAN